MRSDYNLVATDSVPSVSGWDRRRGLISYHNANCLSCLEEFDSHSAVTLIPDASMRLTLMGFCDLRKRFSVLWLEQVISINLITLKSLRRRLRIRKGWPMKSSKILGMNLIGAGLMGELPTYLQGRRIKHGRSSRGGDTSDEIILTKYRFRRRVISSSKVAKVNAQRSASSSDTGGRTISSSLNFDLYHRLFRKASRATASLGFSILAMIALNLLTKLLLSLQEKIELEVFRDKELGYKLVDRYYRSILGYIACSIAQTVLAILDEKGVRCVSLITLSISGIELIAWLNVEFACRNARFVWSWNLSKDSQSKRFRGSTGIRLAGIGWDRARFDELFAFVNRARSVGSFAL
ncbi:unnamed protein product [Microthlaspi erraticum]|uniref:Uncharacterized protein n=1 Tax=Microthlaspi erraticum TaxID=1685480 RepID=A0A6D2JYD0_9BRAS|nr:unnamed protein product [Microthlaspi erraticum]